MEKRKIIFIVGIVALFVAGFFAWNIFTKKKSLTIENQAAVEEPQVTNQETENSSQQSSVNDQQQVEDIKQQPAISNQEDKKSTVTQPTVKKDVAPVAKDKPADNSGDIVNKFVSWGFQTATSRTIKAIIIHTSYNNLGGDVFDFDKVIQEWKDAGVAPHYAIDRSGTIYHLVADNNIAWHAGASKLPDGTTDVNGVSIGIEIINSQDAKFTDAQYSALNQLIASLKKQYPIKYILGHDDIAPGRKTDPWGIEWGKVQK